MIYLNNAAHPWRKGELFSMTLVRELTQNKGHEVAGISDLSRKTLSSLLNTPRWGKMYFTISAHASLSWALTSLLVAGDQVVTSSVEHEAVMLPLGKLEQKGIRVTVVDCEPDGSLCLDRLASVTDTGTKALVLVHASNVTGAILPLAEVITYAKDRGILVILDAAQTVGVLPMDLIGMPVDVIAFTGHKGLLGPAGTGGLVVCSAMLQEQLEQTALRVGLVEAASPNLHCLIALSKGMQFVFDWGVPAIRRHEMELTSHLMEGLREISGVSVYGPQEVEKRIGIVSFRVSGLTPEEVAFKLLTDHDIVCSAGIHHSPNAHQTLGTWPDGTVRISIGLDNVTDEIDYAVAAVSQIANDSQRQAKPHRCSSRRFRSRLEPENCPRVAILPRTVNQTLEDGEWSSLASLANVSVLAIHDEVDLLSGDSWGVSLKHCLEVASSWVKKYDFIIGEDTGAFLWHAVFRLAGDMTPFGLVPHYNHVLPIHAYALLLSSQLALTTDILFAGSATASRSFSQFGFNCRSLYPIGIDLNRFRSLTVSKAAVRASLGLRDNQDILLYTGRLDEDKHVLELIEMFELVLRQRKASLVICYHYFQDRYLRQCEKRAAEIGSVHLVQHPNKETLVRYYNAADLFVTTAVSVFETFGRSPLEAMACGTPPVACQYDGFRDTIPAECGTLVPIIRNSENRRPDICAFADAVLGILDNRSILVTKSQAGIQHVRKYERTTAMREMLNLMVLTSTAKAMTPNDLGSRRLNLERYPEAVRSLWTDLTDRPIYDLVDDLLRTGQIPWMPASSDLQRFHDDWFAHY